jgi:DNA-binding transcriptional MocR family regulator
VTARDPLPDNAGRGNGTPGKAALMDDLDADYTPRYIRLARLLREWIEDGTYPPGSLLPSAARLAEAHTVSKATARHALGVLVKTGHARHVESKPHQVIWRLAKHTGKPR